MCFADEKIILYLPLKWKMRNQKIKKMKTYLVEVPTTGSCFYRVAAENGEEAIDIVMSGEGECIGHNYDEDSDSDNFTVTLDIKMK